jgi:hypothetical protein
MLPGKSDGIRFDGKCLIWEDKNLSKIMNKRRSEFISIVFKEDIANLNKIKIWKELNHDPKKG